MAQPWAIGSTWARATEGPPGGSVSKVSQSPIQKSSWWYSAPQAAEGVVVAGAADAWGAAPTAAKAIGRNARRVISFMGLPMVGAKGFAGWERSRRRLRASTRDFWPFSSVVSEPIDSLRHLQRQCPRCKDNPDQQRVGVTLCYSTALCIPRS